MPEVLLDKYIATFNNGTLDETKIGYCSYILRPDNFGKCVCVRAIEWC